MTVWLALIAFIAAQRLAELVFATSNTRRLLAAGAVETAAGHYPLFVLLHGAWLTCLALLVPADAAMDPWLFAAFVMLQAARLWVVVTLGRFWTTRIVSLPDAPLVRRGPYRFVRHPNYLVVALEIPIVPLIVGAWQVAAVFGILNLALLGWRIRAEDRALAARRETAA